MKYSFTQVIIKQLFRDIYLSTVMTEISEKQLLRDGCVKEIWTAAKKRYECVEIKNCKIGCRY